MTTDFENFDPSTATQEELHAFAAQLGLPDEALKAPDYPEFKATFGYHFKITGAENTVSQKGTEQLKMTVHALDSNGEEVKKARGMFWLPYPFDTETFRFADPEKRERAIRDMAALVKCSVTDGRYDDYARKVQEGTKSLYFDADGNQLVGKAYVASRNRARIGLLKEIDRRRRGDAAAWLGTTFFAQYTTSEWEGNTYKKLMRIGAEPAPGITYILEPAEMMARPGAVDAEKPADGDFF